MPRLPSAADLGPLPTAAPTRPVATYDPSGLARGAQAIAAGVQQLGKGVQAAGEGIGELALDKSRWEYAMAHSDAQAGLIDLHGQLEQDTNYAADDSGRTLAQRHNEAAAERVQQSASLISDPRMRERFTATMAPSLAQFDQKAQTHQRALENNAAVAYTGAQGDNLINKAIAAPDEDTRVKLIDSHNELIDGLVARRAITAVAGVQMKKSWAQQYATADYLHAINSNDPAQTEAAVNRLRAEPGSGDQITNRILQNEGTAKNPLSSATGAGNFIDSTWLDMIKRHRPDLAQGRSDQEILALRADRKLGAEMTEAYRAENEKYLKGQGLPATPGQQYLAHFLGPGAAAAVLKADPNKPIADVLTAAVGDKKAAAMIAANQSILGGQLAGSVTAWADRKMGGDHYDMLHLDPLTREKLLAQGEAQLHKQTTDKISTFHNSVQDDLAESARSGSVTKPKTQADFIAAYGAQHGPAQFAQYQADLQAAADKQMLPSMTDAQMRDLVQRFEPTPGEGYAAGAKRQNGIIASAYKFQQERHDDPAQYGINYLPAVQESWKALTDTMNDATAGPDVRRAMARDYATKTTMEQQRLGITGDAVRIAPQGYIDDIKGRLSAAAASEDPGKRAALVGQIQREAAMWGDSWPAVMRQMADKTQPIVRAIAAGADMSAMTRLLSLEPSATAKTIIGEQNETKLNDVTSKVNDAMAPFRASLVGRQLDRDLPGYQDLAMKLAALHARDGDAADVAAKKAFDELIGNRWEFRDTWRMPKSAGVAADDVQKGVEAAKTLLSARGNAAPNDNLQAAQRELGLTPQETALYQRHLTNLTGAGGVDNENGSRSTLFQMSFERDGKTYNVPTVYDGKILKPDEAIRRAEAEGLDKFPSYGSEAEAEARYGKMHDYMERDTARFLAARRKNPLANVKPPLDDMPGRSGAAASDLDVLSRDGRWVTSYDGAGLNLVTPGGNFARRADDPRQPFMLTWSQLAELGRGAPARTDFGGIQP